MLKTMLKTMSKNTVNSGKGFKKIETINKMITKDLTPYNVYLSSNQLPTLRNLIEVEAKNFNLMTWYFAKDKITCSMINAISTIVTVVELTDFDEYKVVRPVEMSIDPKKFFSMILQDKKRRDIIELMITNDNPEILKVCITDSKISNFEMRYDFYQSDEKPINPSPHIEDADTSVRIHAELFHSTLKGLKAISKKVEIVVRNGSMYLQSSSSFECEAKIKIGEGTTSLLFSEDPDIDAIPCSYGFFSIDTFIQFQKLINHSHLIEIRFFKHDRPFPIVLIYSVGKLGKKYVIITPIVEKKLLMK